MFLFVLAFVHDNFPLMYYVSIHSTFIVFVHIFRHNIFPLMYHSYHRRQKKTINLTLTQPQLQPHKMSIVHAHGYWDGDDSASHHIHDPSLAQALGQFFLKEKANHVVDLGCGMGMYVRDLRAMGIPHVQGYDGNPQTRKLTNNQCGVIDLAVPFFFDSNSIDWVMSLEVGEHLPAQFEDIFIQNLHNNNQQGIVLSWAVKGQGGLGHFNEQNNDYIKAKFAALGYINDMEAENQLRSAASLSWFQRTIMVFRKR